jgi:chloramphenicol 3-O phosphotransferase
MDGKVVILNGTSSSGKTSVAQALQEMTEELYLHVSLDDFYAMLPDWFRRSRSERWPTLTLHMQRALFSTAAVLAEQGYHVVVDTALLDPQDLQACIHALQGHYALLVGLHCSLEETERRERKRGDRVVGLARWQFPLVHDHGLYDLEVDTSSLTPQECAMKIQERLRRSRPDALTQLHTSFLAQEG